MDKQTLRKTLFDFGRALAEHKIPLTFFMGGDVEFNRVDVMNSTEAGKHLKKFLEAETAKAFKTNIENVDELLITYYLMTNTSVLIEHAGTTNSSGKWQPTVDRGVFTLDMDEIEAMHKIHNIEVKDKAKSDLANAISKLVEGYNSQKFKAVRLDWAKCKTTNPRSLMSYDDGVHIIPTDTLVGYYTMLREMSSNEAFKFTYRRVNNADRAQFVTLNRSIINEVYDKDLHFADVFHTVSNPSTINYHGNLVPPNVLTGMWSVGDLGLSRFVHNPKRNISLSRLIEIRNVVQEDVIEIRKYVNVDLDNVLDIFMGYAGQFTPEQKDIVMRDLECNKSDLFEYLNTMIQIFSTTYHKRLHDYMVTNQELFPGYTGVKDSAYDPSMNINGTDLQFGSSESIDF